MKNFYVFLIATLVSGLGFGQTTIYSQDFETNLDGYSHTPSQTPSLDPGDQYFHRAEPSDGAIYESGGPYTNVTNSWLFVGSNPNTINAGSPGILNLGGLIDVSGFSDLELLADFGGVPNDWDATDELRVEYSTDNSNWSLLYSFRSPVTNDPLELENNVSGGSNTANGATLTYTLQTIVSNNFTGISNDLYLRIVCDSDANYEAFGVDNIILQGIPTSSCTPPTTQASVYNSTSVGTTSATLNWTSGDGDEVLVLVKEGSAVDADPTNGTSYTANTAFSSGDQIGTGNFAVYAGTTASSVSVTGLNPTSLYHVAVYEYNTSGTCYLTPALTGSFTTATATSVQFTAPTAFSVAETAGTYDLVIEIANEDVVATTFDVVLTSGDTADIDSYVTVSTSFPGGSATNVSVTVTITDDAIIEGDELFTFEIQNVAGGNSAVVGSNNAFNLTILANDAPPPTEGWQITSENSTFVIDFDTTVDGVNIDAYAGTGFISTPTSGQLDSDAWEVTGLSDGALTYGGTGTSGDFTGTGSGGVTNGGLYAFDTGGGNSTLGAQPTGADLTPGTITLRAHNQTGSVITVADLEYLVYVFNNENRANSFNFSYSTDDVSYTDVATLDINTETTPDPIPSWVANPKATTITGLSIADGDYLYLRWNIEDLGSSGSQDEFALDDITLTFYQTIDYTFNLGTWTPLIPPTGFTPGDNLTIVAGDETFNELTSVGTITIDSGASLTIAKEGALEVIGNTTIDGTLTLESDSNEFSSLIADVTIGGSGELNYERFVNSAGSGATGTGGNDLISAPVGNEGLLTFDNILGFADNSTVIASSGSLYAFAPFNNDSGSYDVYNTDTPDPASIIAGKGYRMAAGANVTFRGSFSSGPIAITINTGTASQWNLIGNPYPSYISSSAFLTENTALLDETLLDPAATAIYGYNSGTYSGADSTIGNFTIINNNTNSGLNIAPGQGFFVASSATGGSVQFSPSMRTVVGADDFIEGRSSLQNYKLVLGFEATTNSSTSFYFNENSSRGLDIGYDAAAFGQNANNSPIYSHLIEDNTGRAMAMQSLGASDFEGIVVPLGVNNNQGNQVRFSINESTLPSTINVYLEDQVTNTMTLLNTSDYVFTPTTNLSGTGRFFLHFADSALSTGSTNLEALSIYTNKVAQTIVISGQLEESTTANLYDLQGRNVKSAQLETSKTNQTIDTSNLSSGVYVIQLTDSTTSKSQKIIIR